MWWKYQDEKLCSYPMRKTETLEDWDGLPDLPPLQERRGSLQGTKMTTLLQFRHLTIILFSRVFFNNELQCLRLTQLFRKNLFQFPIYTFVWWDISNLYICMMWHKTWYNRHSRSGQEKEHLYDVCRCRLAHQANRRNRAYSLGWKSNSMKKV